MSIMTDARLRLLEARVAEIERRIAALVAAPVLAATDRAKSGPAAKSKPRASAHKTSKRTRKTP